MTQTHEFVDLWMSLRDRDAGGLEAGVEVDDLDGAVVDEERAGLVLVLVAAAAEDGEEARAAADAAAVLDGLVRAHEALQPRVREELQHHALVEHRNALPAPRRPKPWRVHLTPCNITAAAAATAVCACTTASSHACTEICIAVTATATSAATTVDCVCGIWV